MGQTKKRWDARGRIEHSGAERVAGRTEGVSGLPAGTQRVTPPLRPCGLGKGVRKGPGEVLKARMVRDNAGRTGVLTAALAEGELGAVAKG